MSQRNKTCGCVAECRCLPVAVPCTICSSGPDHLHATSIGQEDAFVLGDTRAQREGGGGPSFYPRFDPFIERIQAWPSLSASPPACACLDGWNRGASEPVALHMALQQNEPIDEATDWLWVYLMVIPHFPPSWLVPSSPLSLSTNQRQSLYLHLSNEIASV